MPPPHRAVSLPGSGSGSLTALAQPGSGWGLVSGPSEGPGPQSGDLRSVVTLPRPPPCLSQSPAPAQPPATGQGEPGPAGPLPAQGDRWPLPGPAHGNTGSVPGSGVSCPHTAGHQGPVGSHAGGLAPVWGLALLAASRPARGGGGHGSLAGLALSTGGAVVGTREGSDCGRAAPGVEVP